MKKNPSTPCSECAFRRDVEPGALGGSPAETYIGQSIGPFIVPCHCHCNFDDPDWRAKAAETPQCAGLAIFRANIGVSDRLPTALHKLPADHQLVFSDFVEFLMHHKQIDREHAALQLIMTPPHLLLRRELGDPAVRLYDLEAPRPH